jgi:hypothetical protein
MSTKKMGSTFVNSQQNYHGLMNVPASSGSAAGRRQHRIGRRAAALLERVPTTVIEGASRERAEGVQKRLAKFGATAEVVKHSVPGVDYI